MALHDFSDPKLSEEAREAISAAFEAIAECHDEVASSSEKVIAIAQAARALGCPDHVVSGMINQLQSVTKMQIQMMDHTMKTWQEQIKSWPDLSLSGNWPDAEAFKAMSVNLSPVLDTDGSAVAEELGADDDVAVGRALKAERSSQKRRSGVAV